MFFLWTHTYLISPLNSHSSPLDAAPPPTGHHMKVKISLNLFWISCSLFLSRLSCDTDGRQNLMAATQDGGEILPEVPPLFFSPLWFLLTFTGCVTVFLCFFLFCPVPFITVHTNGFCQKLVIMTHCFYVPCPFFWTSLIKSRVLQSETIQRSILPSN